MTHLSKIFLAVLPFCAAAALAESHTAIIQQLATAALMVRGGDSLDRDDFEQVVTLKRTYEEFNPETKEWEVKTSLCSGSVFNQSCVLFAAHCLSNPSQRTVSQEVYVGNSVRGYVTEIGTGNKRKLDVRPLAAVVDSVSRSPKSIEELQKVKPLTEDDWKKFVATDIAMVKLDNPLPAENSFTELNLPNPSTILKGAMGTVVGSGSYSNVPNEEDGTTKEVGSGTKRSGLVEVTEDISGKQPIISVKAGPKNQLATFGDSGGPFLLNVTANHAKAVVTGVISTLNAEKTMHGTANDIVSTLFHKKWILENLEKFGCVSPAVQLTDHVRQEFTGVGAYQREWQTLKKWLPGEPALMKFKSLTRDMLVTQGDLSKDFETVALMPLPPNLKTGELRFEWQARYSKDPEQNQKRIEQEIANGNSGELPKGILSVPR